MFSFVFGLPPVTNKVDNEPMFRYVDGIIISTLLGTCSGGTDVLTYYNMFFSGIIICTNVCLILFILWWGWLHISSSGGFPL